MVLPLLLLTLSVSPPLTPVSPREITLSADARVTYPATQLVTAFQLQVKDRDAATAKKLADEKLKKLLDVLAAAGADPKKLEGHDNGQTPDYRGSEVIGQIGVRSVTMTLTDLSKADAIFQAAHKAGATQNGTAVLSGDATAAEQKARLDAAGQLRTRASAIVEALGGKLGLPRTVSEQNGGSIPQATRYFPVAADGSVLTNAHAIELVAAVRITVQFDLKDE
ncbi:MAG: SIMPL domain-containing protein [Myxococcaceae bacterium]